MDRYKMQSASATYEIDDLGRGRYRIEDGACAGVSFLASDEPRNLLEGTHVRVTFYPDDQYARREERLTGWMVGYDSQIHYWIGRLNHRIAAFDVPRIGRHLKESIVSKMDRRDRTRVRLLDSLLWAFEEAAEGRLLYSFRALLQAQGYAGELGGFPDQPAADALVVLRNLCEASIQRLEAIDQPGVHP